MCFRVAWSRAPNPTTKVPHHWQGVAIVSLAADRVEGSQGLFDFYIALTVSSIIVSVSPTHQPPPLDFLLLILASLSLRTRRML
jgi:hypothetical protein